MCGELRRIGYTLKLEQKVRTCETECNIKISTWGKMQTDFN